MEMKALNELKNAKSIDDLIKIAKDSGLHLDANSAEKIFKEIKKGGNMDIGGILKSVLGGSAGNNSRTDAAKKTGTEAKKNESTEKAVEDALGSVLKKVIK